MNIYIYMEREREKNTYIHIYIYTHIYIHIMHLYTYIYIYIYIYTHVMYIYIYISQSISYHYVYVYIYIYTHIYYITSQPGSVVAQRRQTSPGFRPGWGAGKQSDPLQLGALQGLFGFGVQGLGSDPFQFSFFVFNGFTSVKSIILVRRLAIPVESLNMNHGNWLVTIERSPLLYHGYNHTIIGHETLNKDLIRPSSDIQHLQQLNQHSYSWDVLPMAT